MNNSLQCTTIKGRCEHLITLSVARFIQASNQNINYRSHENNKSSSCPLSYLPRCRSPCVQPLSLITVPPLYWQHVQVAPCIDTFLTKRISTTVLDTLHDRRSNTNRPERGVVPATVTLLVCQKTQSAPFKCINQLMILIKCNKLSIVMIYIISVILVLIAHTVFIHNIMNNLK